ncbi:MAG: T9SS type A sorting domain-containing protein [Candidatus Saccharibacteria bacterium]
MRKLFLPIVMICCMSLISLAAETKLYTGDVTPSLFSRMDMISWAMGEIKTDARYVNFGTDAEPAFARTTVNPVKTGLNASDNALQLSSLKGKSWWPDFLNLDLTDPITITAENRYLHFYHFRENLNARFSVNINKDTPWEDADKGTKRFDMNLSKPGVWEDVVVDLKWFMDNNEPLSRICVLMDMNWGGGAEAATNYYFDEIVLNNSNLPRGINILTESEISFFPGNNASYTKYVSALDLQNGENTSEVVANPFTAETAVDNSASVLKFNKSANAAWWQGPRFKLNGTLQVGQNGASSYLHVLVNIPEMEAGKDYYVVQLNAKDFMGKQIDSGDAIKYWADDKGKWMDCVFDVSSLGYVSEFTVRFDVRRNDQDALVSSPAGVFYLDAAAINASDAQRETVTAPTGVKAVGKEPTKIYARNRSILVEGKVASIEVYNLLGSMVKQVAANASTTEIPVAKTGVYLVKTVSASRNVFTSKVIVK